MGLTQAFNMDLFARSLPFPSRGTAETRPGLVEVSVSCLLMNIGVASYLHIGRREGNHGHKIRPGPGQGWTRRGGQEDVTFLQPRRNFNAEGQDRG